MLKSLINLKNLIYPHVCFDNCSCTSTTPHVCFDRLSTSGKKGLLHPEVQRVEGSVRAVVFTPERSLGRRRGSTSGQLLKFQGTRLSARPDPGFAYSFARHLLADPAQPQATTGQACSALSKGRVRVINASMFSLLLSTIIVSPLLATAPRVTLENFEKDLQAMAKASKSIVVKGGSFIDKVAAKRRHKELIDQDLASLQSEIDELKKEVVQLDSQGQELEEKLTNETQHLEQRIAQVEHVVVQLEQEQSCLRHPTTP